MPNLRKPIIYENLPDVIVVSGTDTGVGKTVASAAVAARLRSAGIRPHIYKPVQTGLIAADHPQRSELEQNYRDVVTRGDAQVAGELANCPYSTGAAFALPMAPQAAAAESQEDLPTAADHAACIQQLLQHHEVVIVEGAGGLLVDLGDHTLADIASQLQDQHHVSVQVVVVVRAELGTLNHTALTVEALHHRGLDRVGVVIGSWPARPMPVALSNRDQLGRTYPLLAVIPDGAGVLEPETFQSQVPSWFASDHDLLRRAAPGARTFSAP